LACHSEERSDEEFLFNCGFLTERFFDCVTARPGRRAEEKARGHFAQNDESAKGILSMAGGKKMRRSGIAVWVFVAAGAVLASVAFGLQPQSAAGKPAQAAQVAGAGKAVELASAVQIEPAALAKLYQECIKQVRKPGAASVECPEILHVGFKNFYDQARIPLSDYAGPGSTPAGLELLRKRVSSLQRKQLIVLYCGCCPWDKCPNAKPAYDALHAMGFTNVKVAHIAENFGANWVNAGLPTEKAQ
jgi:thiosulfate/3-mercaptopyruvate sulfurtransferase